MGHFHLRKPLLLRMQQKQRMSQQRGSVSARADVPPLRWRPIPQSPAATGPNAAWCHGSYSSSSSFCCVFWHLWQVSFSFFLGRKGFGLVRDRSGSMKLSKEPQPGQGAEGKRRSQALPPSASRKLANGISDRSETGFHKHCWRREEYRNERAENTAAAVFN